MPRPVLVPGSTAGVISYTLGGNEEFEVVALTVTCDPNDTNPDVLYFLEFVSPIGKNIHRQILGGITPAEGYNTPLLASAALGAGDMQQTDYWWLITGPGTGIGDDEYGSYRSVGLPRLPLTTNCTVRVFGAGFWQTSPAQPPFELVDTSAQFADLHLWVEDTNALGRNLPNAALPLLLGVGS